LIDATPVAPLLAVDRAELAGLIRPRIPDRGVLREIVVDIRGAAEEPQQLANDGRKQHLLRGHERKAIPQVVADLRAEHGERSGSGAIDAALAAIEHVAQEIEVRPHVLTYSIAV